MLAFGRNLAAKLTSRTPSLLTRTSLPVTTGVRSLHSSPSLFKSMEVSTGEEPFIPKPQNARLDIRFAKVWREREIAFTAVDGEYFRSLSKLLIEAAPLGHLDLVKKVFISHPELRRDPSSYSGAFVSAAKAQQLEVIQFFLEQPTVCAQAILPPKYASQSSSFGCHAAYWAAMQGNIPMLRLLTSTLPPLQQELRDYAKKYKHHENPDIRKDAAKVFASLDKLKLTEGQKPISTKNEVPKAYLPSRSSAMKPVNLWPSSTKLGYGADLHTSSTPTLRAKPR